MAASSFLPPDVPFPPPPCGHLQSSPAGAFNRALGTSGFTLVNVANVPISLGRWMVGNDPATNR